MCVSPSALQVLARGGLALVCPLFQGYSVLVERQGRERSMLHILSMFLWKPWGGGVGGGLVPFFRGGHWAEEGYVTSLKSLSWPAMRLRSGQRPMEDAKGCKARVQGDTNEQARRPLWVQQNRVGCSQQGCPACSVCHSSPS